MTTTLILRAGLALALAAAPAAAVAESPAGRNATPPQQQREQRAVPEAPSARIVYTPPPRSAPGGRIGGSTRGLPGDALNVNVVVLAPDHAGLTADPRPVLYWFLSAPTAAPVEVILDRDDPTTPGEPLLEARLKRTPQPGINRIALADHGVALAPGVTYRWSVAVVADPDRRSPGILASGLIRHDPPPPELAAALRRAAEADRPRLYAAEGYWYDALAGLSRLIERAPRPADRVQLQLSRADLLEAVGLAAPAAFDRTAAAGSTAAAQW